MSYSIKYKRIFQAPNSSYWELDLQTAILQGFVSHLCYKLILQI